MDVNKRAERYLTNRKNRKRKLPLQVILSLLVTICVVSNLIMPAISMTIDQAGLGILMTEEASTTAATPGTPSTLPDSNMLDITSADKWLASMSKGDNYFFEATQAGVITNTGYSTVLDQEELSVYIEYEFTQSVKDILNAAGTGPHLAWDLGNPDLTAIFPNGADHGQVTDPAYPADYAGTYVIENGIIKVTLTENYLNFVNGGMGAIKGSLDFSGILEKSETEDGNQKFTMAGEIVVIDFPDTNAKLNDKSAYVNTSNGTVEWTIVIENANKANMTNYLLKDDMLKSATSITFTPEGAGTYTTGTNTVGFTDVASSAPWITIKYTTPITQAWMEAKSISNTASLTSKDGTKTYGDDKKATAYFNNVPINVSKNGTQDYQSGVYEGKINWTVTVTNNYGLLLTNYIIEDPKLTADAQVSDGTILTPLGNNKWQINSTASSVNITYTTTAVPGEENGVGKNANTAQAYYPDGTKPSQGGSTATNVTYKTESELFAFDKQHSTNTDGTITWTLNISNLNGLDMAGYTITDKMLAAATEVNIPTNWVNGVQTPLATLENGVLTFTDATKGYQWITITYKTRITEDQLQGNNRTNDAQLKNPDTNTVIKSDSETAGFTRGDNFTLSKTGTPDYVNGTHGNVINWTVRITSTYGTSLDGYLLEDAKLPDPTNGDSWPLSPSGSITKNADGKWVLSGTNGARTVTLTYPAAATEGNAEANTNTATLYYPDNTTTGATDSEGVEYKGYDDLISLGKSGWYSQDAHEMNWSITISTQGGVDIPAGYYIVDEMLKQARDGSISFNPSNVNVSISKEDGKISFNADHEGNVTITYRTLVTIADGQTKIEPSNTVRDGMGHSDTWNDATYDVRNTLNKYSNQGNSFYIVNNGRIEKTLNWTANLVWDGSFMNSDGTGKSYEDILTVTSGEGTHTITAAQLAAISITARKGQYDAPTPLVAGTHYTAEPTENGFKVTFTEEMDKMGYNFVDINYNTTIVANAPTGTDYPYTYVYGNTAEFNGNKDTDNNYTITRQNPVKNLTMDLSIRKNWQNDVASDRPAAVITRVLYNTNQDGTWRYLKTADGKAVYYGDAAYASAADYTVTLNADGNWVQQITGLRKETATADANGDQTPSVNYFYKIEEITPDGKTIENELYETTDGYYQVSYSNNGGINYSDTIDVTNKFYRNQTATPKKYWTGDTGSGTGIDSVTVQLEYSIGETLYNNPVTYPVKMLNGEYVFDKSTTTEGAEIVTQDIVAGDGSWTGTAWTGLPSIVLVDGQLKECTYYISETAVTLTAAEGGEATIIPLEGSKFVTPDGYYTSSNSVGNGGTLTVTNSFKKNTTYTIGTQKKWEGDVNNADSRPDIVLVQLQRSTDNYNWTDIGDPVELSAATSWGAAFENLPNQEGSVAYFYRVMEVGYKMTAESSEVEYPDNTYAFATDANGNYNISYSTQSLNQAGTVTITNTFVPVGEIELTPQKKWVGDAGRESTDRPKSITFTLQRKLGWSGTWENVTDENGNVTVTLQNDENTTTEQTWEKVTVNGVEIDGYNTIWNGTTIRDLPAEVVAVKADGTFDRQTCYYRFVETSYVPASGGNAVTIEKDAESFSTENGKYEIVFGDTYSTGTLAITNTFNESIGIEKYVLDKDGNVVDPVIQMEDLEKFKYTLADGEQYYIFNWAIKYDAAAWGDSGNDGDKLPTIKDHLPDGFELVEDAATWVGTISDEKTKDTKYSTYWYNNVKNLSQLFAKYNSDYFLHPAIIWIEATISCGGQPARSIEEIYEWYMYGKTSENSKFNTNPDLWYYYDKENNDVYFNKYKSTSTSEIYYAIKIKCSELDAKIAKGSYTITNTAYTYDDTSINSTGRQPILNTVGSLKIVNPIDTNLISKSYSETIIPGNIQYSLNINPEGKNLSSGDTIDIQDLFKTVSYFDHDFGASGELSTGEKLVDVLMNNIKIYEVDANGNKIELSSSDYTLMFQSGTEVSDGAALMKLTIPDETHIVVDYIYKLIANERTPSVIHGCKSSTRVNGRYATMAPGLVPPADDVITFSNTASLISDSAESSDSKENTEYRIAQSSGTISTNALPSIKKVNTGDYSIDNLSATFLLARYENGKWYYVDSAEVIDEAKGEYDITWGVNGAEGTKISTDAIRIEIVGDSDFKVALDENMLYKLVEIVVPEDYEGSNLGLTEEQFEEMIRAYLNDGATVYQEKDYRIFLNHYISTHYFTYNSTMTSYPAGIAASDVVQVKSGSDVEIPNNKLIDIGVKKEWVNPITSVTNSQITVELYWSYTKDTTGIPADAELATAEALGILDENFTATKTITVGDEANAQLWTNLPNGTDKKPIYYYIKETAYSIGGKSYFYNAESKNFQTADGEPGAYLPTYTGNAANDDAVIDVKNSYQLMLKKEWKNSANIEMKNIPVEGVVVSIYGMYDEDGVTVQTEDPLFEGIELSKANNWTADLTSKLTNIKDLSIYKAFVAVENENPDLEGYVVSCVFNLNAQTGEIIVTNKNTVPTEASVTVNKLWSDGNKLHTNDSIGVALYQTQTEIGDLTNLASKITMMKLEPMQAEDGTEYKVTLNAENEWTYSWTGLPLEDEEQNKYYYYVLEDMAGVADASEYTATYVVTDKTPTKTEYTVKNYRQAIVAEKKWLAEDNSAISPEMLAEMGIDSITLEVLKDVATVPEDGLNIVALGDSITRGGYNNVAESSRYPQQLETILESTPYNYSNVSVISQGQDTTQIPNFETRLGDVNENTDIVCVLGGTNDIHQDGSTREITEIRDRMASLITAIKNKNTNIIIVIGSIPHFDFVEIGADGTSWKYTTAATWWGGSNTSWTQQEWQTFEDACNKRIDDYNALLKTLAESTDNVYFADVCAAVDKDTMLYSGDGCHPNADGYKAIAQTYATAINSLYNQSANVTEVTLTADKNWMAAIDIDDADPDAEYYVNEKDLPAGWTVTYSGSPQKIGSSTPLVVTNKKYTPKTTLSVEKTWRNDGNDTTKRDEIKLHLMQSTDLKKWFEVGEMPQPSKDGDVWTYTYTNLPAEDEAGKKLYYMVEEDPMQGYTTSYPITHIAAVPGGTCEVPLTVINTRQLNLKLQKIWQNVDASELVGKTVTVIIRRGTSPNDVPEDKELILQVANKNVAVGVGATETITANKKITGATSDKENIATVTLNEDGTVTITGVADGTATITVTDGKTEEEITVIVSSLELFLNGGSNFQIAAGSTGTLSVKESGTSVTADSYTSSNSGIISVSGTTITANALGTADITAKYGDLTITQTIEVVLPSTFSITGESEVTIGETIDLNIDKNYGTFTWTSSNTAFATVDADGVVTGVADGTVTITATRDNGDGTTTEATKTVTVKNGDIFVNSNVVVRVPVGGTVQIESPSSTSGINAFDYHDGSIVQTTINGNKITLVGVKAGTKVLKAWRNNYSESAEFTVIVYNPLAISPATKTLAYDGTVTLTPNTTDTVEYTITSGSNLITLNGNTVTAKSGTEGTAVITAKNTVTGETATVTIEVVAEITTISGTLKDEQADRTYTYEYDPTLGTITINFNEDTNSINYHIRNALKADDVLKDLIPIKYQVEVTAGNTNIYCRGPGVSWQQFSFNGTTGTVDVSSNTTSFANNNNETGIWQGSNTPITYTIFVKTTAPAAASVTPTNATLSRMAARPVGDTMALAVDESWTMTVELVNTAEQNWTDTIVLDVCDKDNKTYYYWVEEVQMNGYDVTYLFNDGDPESTHYINPTKPDANGEFSVTICNTKKEVAGVTMPSTGGTGTKPYYGIGVIFLTVSAAGYLMLRRRQKDESK